MEQKWNLECSNWNCTNGLEGMKWSLQKPLVTQPTRYNVISTHHRQFWLVPMYCTLTPPCFMGHLIAKNVVHATDLLCSLITTLTRFWNCHFQSCIHLAQLYSCSCERSLYLAWHNWTTSVPTWIFTVYCFHCYIFQLLHLYQWLCLENTILQSYCISFFLLDWWDYMLGAIKRCEVNLVAPSFEW